MRREREKHCVALSPHHPLNLPLTSATTKRAAGFAAFLGPVSFHFALVFLFIGTQTFLLLQLSVIKNQCWIKCGALVKALKLYVLVFSSVNARRSGFNGRLNWRAAFLAFRKPVNNHR